MHLMHGHNRHSDGILESTAYHQGSAATQGRQDDIDPPGPLLPLRRTARTRQHRWPLFTLLVPRPTAPRVSAEGSGRLLERGRPCPSATRPPHGPSDPSLANPPLPWPPSDISRSGRFLGRHEPSSTKPDRERSPFVHLDRLAQWAAVLHIPEDRLWFALPAANEELDEKEGTVNRRQFLSSTAATAASGFLYDPSIPAQPIGDHEAVDWLAWHLWQNRKDELDPSRIPQPISHRLNAHPHVLRTAGGAYRFTDPALTDVLVAHRVFGDIAQGSGHLLATAQTSHATDLTISALAAENEQARRGLTAWMRSGATAVLRVNSAGILAKVGAADLSDAAISAIRSDRDARHLYVTAVASRVLELPWGRAADLSGATNTHAADWTLGEGDGTKAWASRRPPDELANNRDAAARWCIAVLLATCIDVEGTRMRSALMLAVKNEPCRENLRAYAAVLAGATPLKIG